MCACVVELGGMGGVFDAWCILRGAWVGDVEGTYGEVVVGALAE